MIEVVKTKNLKLLDVCVIFPSWTTIGYMCDFPITDSKWVVPILMMPKKTGLTMVKNA